MNNQQIESKGSVQPDARAAAPQHSRQRRRLAVVAGLALSVGLPTLGMTCLPAIAAAAPQPAAQQDAAASELPQALEPIAKLDEKIRAIGSSSEVAAKLAAGQLTQDQEMLFLRRSLIHDAGYVKVGADNKAHWEAPASENAGYDKLAEFARKDAKNAKFLQWLLTDYETLQLYVTGGIPGGRAWWQDGASHVRSIGQFMALAEAHPDDITPGKTPEADRIVYKKMMISAALGMNDRTRLWTGNNNDVANVVDRYEIIKVFRRDHEKYRFQKSLFDQLTVENMRWVFENRISNEEMPWLANYSLARFAAADQEGARLNPYSYIEYTKNYEDHGGYKDPEFFEEKSLYTEAIAQEAPDTGKKIPGGWAAKYQFRYNDPNFPNQNEGDPFYLSNSLDANAEKIRLWIPFEDGGVCGSVSKTCENIHGIVGVPAAVGGQPAHAACPTYSLVDDTTTEQQGDLAPFYTIKNDSGASWLRLGGTEMNHLPCEWTQVHTPEKDASGKVTNLTTTWGDGTFILMAQDALNDMPGYLKVTELLELAKAQSNPDERLKVVEQALKVQPYNWDALMAKLNIYKEKQVSAGDWVAFAKQIATDCVEYPYPMQSFLVRIEQEAKDAGAKFQIEAARVASLQKAAQMTEKGSVQHAAIRDTANRLLGSFASDMFAFSFDGEEAGVLKLGQQFDATQPSWKFSVDGGKTWTEVTNGAHEARLTPEQLAAITAENDIQIQVIGVDETYRLDITEAPAPTGYAANNFDHRIHGMDGKPADAIDVLINGTWVQNTEDSIFSGDQTLEIRQRAFGTSVPSRETSKITFTTAWNAPEGVMVPLKEMRVNSVSSTHSNMKPEYVIDGYTSASASSQQLWHSNAEASGPWITVDLGKERDLTHVDMWVRCDRPGNGVPYEVEVLTAPEQNPSADAAVDASKFTVAGKFGNFDWQNPTAGMPAEMRRLTFEQPVRARYVRVHATNCRGNFFTLQELAFFERAGQ